MRTDTTLRPICASRGTWPAMATALMLLTGAFWVTGLAVPAAAQASTTAVNQCNGHGPAAQGATTAMRCTGSVVNTISGTTTYSTTTVTRLCTLGPCSAGNGTFTTGSIALVTTISACNSSDNDAAHAISCTVKVTNNIGVNTSGAQQVSPASVHQCVGSAAGRGAGLSTRLSHRDHAHPVPRLRQRRRRGGLPGRPPVHGQRGGADHGQPVQRHRRTWADRR